MRPIIRKWRAGVKGARIRRPCTLVVGWAAWVYFAEDWALARLAVIGLALHSGSLFVVWLLTLPQYDRARHNLLTYGLVLGVSAVLLIATYVRQDLAHRRLTRRGPAVQAARP